MSKNLLYFMDSSIDTTGLLYSQAFLGNMSYGLIDSNEYTFYDVTNGSICSFRIGGILLPDYNNFSELQSDYDILGTVDYDTISQLDISLEQVRSEYLYLVNEGKTPDEINQYLIDKYVNGYSRRMY